MSSLFGSQTTQYNNNNQANPVNIANPVQSNVVNVTIEAADAADVAHYFGSARLERATGVLVVVLLALAVCYLCLATTRRAMRMWRRCYRRGGAASRRHHHHVDDSSPAASTHRRARSAADEAERSPSHAALAALDLKEGEVEPGSASSHASCSAPPPPPPLAVPAVMFSDCEVAKPDASAPAVGVSKESGAVAATAKSSGAESGVPEQAEAVIDDTATTIIQADAPLTEVTVDRRRCCCFCARSVLLLFAVTAVLLLCVWVATYHIPLRALLVAWLPEFITPWQLCTFTYNAYAYAVWAWDWRYALGSISSVLISVWIWLRSSD